jgi:nucleotide-binding universal stress UspA family protein
MSIKSIVVQIDETPASEVRARYAASMATVNRAHVTGVITHDPLAYLYPGIESFSSFIDEVQIEMERRIKLSKDRFVELMKTLAVESFEARVEVGDPASQLCLAARYSDVVIVGRIDEKHVSPLTPSDLAEQLVLSARRPVIIVPPIASPQFRTARIAVLWNGSREASAAVKDALLLLQSAKEVHIVVFDSDPGHDRHGEEPGADIAWYLARHGVNAVIVREVSDGDVGEEALSYAIDRSIDLIVMGGYGHSRVRELILGGVSRTLLKHANVPLFMVH